ncbi:MAG: FecR domain-containing protein [Anaerolineae bacterium]|nr:FecR domain-containing protein [Anaerolineae bacterium]
MTQRQTPSPENRWSDAQLERLLAESGRRTSSLRPEQRAQVLKVLLAEQERLRQEAIAQARAPQRPRWSAADWLRVVAGALAAAAGLALVLSLYLLFGGTRLPAEATLSGLASISERRYGLFGASWSIAQPEQSYVSHPLARGDEIVARSQVTVTFADGSTAALSAGAQARVLEEGVGLFLLSGTVENVVQPRSAASPFRIETQFGSMIVEGTVFRTTLQPEAALEFTDEGVVLVSNAVEARRVITGEQVRVVSVEPLRPELQPPRARFTSRLADRILTNEAALPFQSTIYPSATLVVYDARTQSELGRFRADRAGRVSGAIPLAEGQRQLQLRQISPDGRQSALSPVIQVEVDRTSPALQLEPIVRQGARLRIVGRAEVGASVTVNGLTAPVQADGRFEVLIEQSRAPVTVVARDAAGNTTTIVKQVE